MGTNHNRSANQRIATEDLNALMDVEALAARLGVNVRFVRRLVAERRMPFLKIGKFIRFEPKEVEDWIEAHRVRPNAQ